MLTEEQKLNIIKNSEEIIRLLKKKKEVRIAYCEICGEPSRNKLCKKCELMTIQK